MKIAMPLHIWTTWFIRFKDKAILKGQWQPFFFVETQGNVAGFCTFVSVSLINVDYHYHYQDA